MFLVLAEPGNLRAQTLEVILNAFPSSLSSLFPAFLTQSLNHLSHLHPIYKEYYLASSSDSLIPTNSEEDSEVSSSLTDLVGTVLDFLSQAARRNSWKSFWKGEGAMGLGLELALKFAGMTCDDVSVDFRQL